MNREDVHDLALAWILCAMFAAIAAVVMLHCKPNDVRSAIDTLDDTCSTWTHLRDAGGE